MSENTTKNMRMELGGYSAGEAYTSSSGEMSVTGDVNYTDTITGTYDPINFPTLPAGELEKTEPAYLGDEFNAVVIVVTIVLCAGAVILNLGIMTYYWPKIKNLIPFLYFILSSSDFVTGVCAGVHSIIFITIIALKYSGLNSIVWLIIPSYFLTVVTFKVSAFVSMIFAVIRTISIASPFTRIRRKPAIISIFVWLLIWVAVSSLEIGMFVHRAHLVKRAARVAREQEVNIDGTVSEVVLIGYFYQPNTGKVFQSNHMKGEFGDGIDHDDYEAVINECLIGMIYTASPVFLCASITLIATIIQVIFLLKTSGVMSGISDPEGDLRAKKKISVTIIQIGGLFIVCSACTLYQPLVNCFAELESARFSYYRRVYVSGYIPFFLNAALNPLILVLRASHLRVYMSSIFTNTHLPVRRNQALQPC